MCVQRLDDSLNSAIRTTYRSSLRSSSKHEPRGPPLEVVLHQQSKLPEGLLFKQHHAGLPRIDRAKTKANNRAGLHTPAATAATSGTGPVRRGLPLATAQRRTNTRAGRRDERALDSVPRDSPGPFTGAQGEETGKRSLYMILPQVHLRKPCYDFYFL